MRTPPARGHRQPPARGRPEGARARPGSWGHPAGASCELPIRERLGCEDARMNGIARGAAVLFALTWLIRPGWGVIDLSVSWSAAWNPVLSGGWGLFFSVLVAAPFLVVAVRPGAAAPAVWTILVAAGSLLVAAVLSLEPQIVGLLVWLLLGLAAVAFASVVERWHPMTPSPRLRGVTLAVV